MQPLWTWGDGYIVQDTSCIIRSLVCVNADRKSICCSLVCFSQSKVFEIDCLVIDRCYFMRYPTHRKSICTVWSDGKFNNFIIQVEIREYFFSWNSILRQDLDAICKFFRDNRVRNAQLTQRTDHPKGFQTTDFPFFNLVVVRDTSTWKSHHHLDACSNIWCSTDDLTGFFFTHIDLADMQVCFGHIFTRQDFTDDNF